MQSEFDAKNLPVQIIGVNEAGFEVGNEYITADRQIPWLQDTEEANVWETWSIHYRDVHLLDSEHNLRYIFNLTNSNLQEPHHYEQLQQAILGLLSE